MSFEIKKYVVSNKERLLEEKLQGTQYKENTRKNIILLHKAFMDDTFGRSDIVVILRIPESTARDLIKKMKDSNLIVPVSGHGKGRYRFITEEDEKDISGGHL